MTNLFIIYDHQFDDSPVCPQSVSCDTPTNESGSQDGGYPFSACSHNPQGVGADFFTPARMGTNP
ncbi:Uncharacterised protein [Moraxella caprae]|uniref:Uncharacterized protein n=1 Tax=Moraxella caprae TaxID=90240 RepID=A0A378R361_9GAMM|nr:hypothetical protein [Moraxella caprae]STZ08300.1 Uncharacterised protein [Moraxella caprae]